MADEEKPDGKKNKRARAKDRFKALSKQGIEGKKLKRIHEESGDLEAKSDSDPTVSVNVAKSPSEIVEEPISKKKMLTEPSTSTITSVDLTELGLVHHMEVEFSSDSDKEEFTIPTTLPGPSSYMSSEPGPSSRIRSSVRSRLFRAMASSDSEAEFVDPIRDLSSSASDRDTASSPSQYIPTPLKRLESKYSGEVSPEEEIQKINMTLLSLQRRKQELENALSVITSSTGIEEVEGIHGTDAPYCLFIGESDRVTGLIETVNEFRRCRTTNCKGDLVPLKVETSRHGCGIVIQWSCDGCQQSHLRFDSRLLESSRRSVVSLSTCVAFIIFGCLFADYNKVLRLGLGMDALNKNSFSQVIELLHKPVEEMLFEQCEANKTQMKDMDESFIGSWKRAVTSSDGVWQTRGFFSKNFTFSVWNYINGGLLYFQHLCQKGTDNIIEDGLYGGTSKAAEGFAVENVFRKASEEGMIIEVNWQDADSSSGKAFEKAFEGGSSNIMLCGGHVNRAHTKVLKERMKTKSFSDAFKRRHQAEFPDVLTVKCECEKGNHKKNCGCLKENFITQARVNLFCAMIEADTSPEKLKTILYQLGEYHSRDIHEWDGGHCLFHPIVVCSCGSCADEELKCDGKKYSSRVKVTCPLHSLAYEIEIKQRAKDVNKIIHPDLGKGHSNIPESVHNILIHFRSKNWNVHRLHYFVSTNLGLLQANSVFMNNNIGTEYCWIGDLYKRLGLPVLPNLIKEWEIQMKRKIKRREFTTSNAYRGAKTLQKKARSLEQLERKKWLNAKSLQHSYGTVSGDEDEESDDDSSWSTCSDPEQTLSGNAIDTFQKTVPSTSKCKCGSVTHKRTSHRDCLLRKK